MAPSRLIRVVLATCTGLALLVGSTADAGAPRTLDWTFGKKGKVFTDFGRIDGIADVAVQPNGRIVAVGDSWTLGTGEDHFALARYRKSGALDSGFGSAGRVTTDFGLQASAAHAVAVQPDGKIVVAGVAGGGSTGAEIALARYDAGGALDPSFGSGGRVLTDLGGGSFEAAFAMVLQPDGKIVVAGPTRPPGSYDDHPPDFVLARYTPAGTLDPTFGGTGVVTKDFQAGWADTPYGVALAPGGKIVVAGTGLPDGNSGPGVIDIARYDANGNLDPTFDGDGALVSAPTDDNGAYGGIVVQPDGKVVVPGAVSLGAMAVIRYTAAGALDHSFGLAHGGVATAPLGYATDVVRQPDGKFVAVGGKAISETNSEFAIARFDRSGTPDRSFHGGTATTDFGGWDYAQAVALQQDGKIVVGGNSGLALGGFDQAGDFALARYLSLPSCRVPNVVGKTLRAAKAALEKASCRLGRIGRRASARVARGRVVSQRPAPGRALANGSKIDLVLSRGRG
jgi:uncharacterized delta-60 repeat protein